MSELTLLILRLAFLAVIVAVSFLPWSTPCVPTCSGRKQRRQAADAAASTRFLPTARAGDGPLPSRTDALPPPAQDRPNIDGALVITSGPKAGLEIRLPTRQLAIGRSSGIGSRQSETIHLHPSARLMLWNDGVVAGSRLDERHLPQRAR